MSDQVPEGSTSYHDYEIYSRPVDGVSSLVGVVEKLEYRLLNNLKVPTVLIDWTEVLSPTSTGTIEIDADFNVSVSKKDTARYLTLRAEHSSGKVATVEITYDLILYKGIEPEEV
jgi:hypothetical protein